MQHMPVVEAWYDFKFDISIQRNYWDHLSITHRYFYLLWRWTLSTSDRKMIIQLV